jgi:hypothetical protein
MGDYSTTLPTQKRHSILRGLVRKNGYATTIRDISLRATLNKHHKTAREKMLKDMHWLQAEHK